MRLLSIVALVLPFVACGGDGASDDGGGLDLGVDAPFAPPDGDGHGPPVSGIGDTCSGEVCPGSIPCAVTSTGCMTALCLTDPSAPLGVEDYCTIQCPPRACPPGFHCERVYGPSDGACVADPTVCGDHVVERGEQCDDGNTTSGDGCDSRCLNEPVRPATVAADVSLAGSGSRRTAARLPAWRSCTSVAGSMRRASCPSVTSDGTGGTVGDGGTFDPVALWTCPTFGRVDVSATLAWTTGSYDLDTPVGAYALAVCADVRFADAPGCMQRYCAETGATPSHATWDVTPGDGGVHGMLAAHLVPSGAPVPDPDGGCMPVYGPTLDVNATVDRRP